MESKSILFLICPKISTQIYLYSHSPNLFVPEFICIRIRAWKLYSSRTALYIQLYSLYATIHCWYKCTLLEYKCTLLRYKCTVCGQGSFTMVLMISFMLQINSWQPKPMAMESGGNLWNEMKRRRVLSGIKINLVFNTQACSSFKVRASAY